MLYKTPFGRYLKTSEKRTVNREWLWLVDLKYYKIIIEKSNRWGELGI